MPSVEQQRTKSVRLSTRNGDRQLKMTPRGQRRDWDRGTGSKHQCVHPRKRDLPRRKPAKNDLGRGTFTPHKHNKRTNDKHNNLESCSRHVLEAKTQCMQHVEKKTRPCYSTLHANSGQHVQKCVRQRSANMIEERSSPSPAPPPMPPPNRKQSSKNNSLKTEQTQMVIILCQKQLHKTLRF